MEYLWLRIVICFVVVVTLSLYLYGNGAHRVYDIIISAVVLIATCLVFAILAAVSAARNKKVFDTSDGGLKFTFPKNNVLNKLPFFVLVFIGRKHIMPLLLLEKK